MEKVDYSKGNPGAPRINNQFQHHIQELELLVWRRNGCSRKSALLHFCVHEERRD
uniref:Uncharacterized protein n=1 Tax=Physcomitrium patens TaxID=3218 RepID=A0A2K1IER2_PHYPA|nr:hypothetical protein PHYPA_029916 [Physcomitrium patens]